MLRRELISGLKTMETKTEYGIMSTLDLYIIIVLLVVLALVMWAAFCTMLQKVVRYIAEIKRYRRTQVTSLFFGSAKIFIKRHEWNF